MTHAPTPDALKEVRRAANRPTTSALHDAIRAAVRDGVRQAEIVRATGLSRAQVSRVARGATSGRHTLPPADEPLVRTLPAAEVIASYRAGEPTRVIGERYGCSKTTIINVMKRHDVKRRTTRRIELPVPTQEIVRRYRDERQEIQQIAADLDVAPALISRRLAEGGAKVPLGHRRMDLPDEEIRRHRDGESIGSLATSFGVARPTIVRRIREKTAPAPA